MFFIRHGAQICWGGHTNQKIMKRRCVMSWDTCFLHYPHPRLEHFPRKEGRWVPILLWPERFWLQSLLSKEVPSLPGYGYWAVTGLTGPKEKGWQCHGSVSQMDGRRSGEWCPWIIFGLYPMAVSYRNRSGNWNRPQCVSLLVDISLLQPCLLFCSSVTYENLAWSGSSLCMSHLYFTFN